MNILETIIFEDGALPEDELEEMQLFYLDGTPVPEGNP